MTGDPTGDIDNRSAGTGTMAGHGFYAEHSQPQHAAAAMGLDLLAAAAGRVPLPDDRSPIVLADLGAAEGRNSRVPMGVATDALRARTDAQVMVVHTDLPGNDWGTFFEVLSADDPRGGVAEPPGHVFSFAAGRSFYDRVVPDDTLSIAWTSSTLHWLSRAPSAIDGHFFVQSSRDRGARERYRAQSVRDWERFLACRARELREGGAVVFVDTLMGDDATMGAEALFDALQESIAAATGLGLVTDAAAGRLAYPAWFRTAGELQSPFGAGVFTSPGGGELELEVLEPQVLEDPFLAAYGTSGDADAYAAGQVAFLQGFLEPSFRAQLAGTGSSHDALAHVWADLHSRIVDDPVGLSPAWRMVAGTISRRRC